MTENKRGTRSLNFSATPDDLQMLSKLRGKLEQTTGSPFSISAVIRYALRVLADAEHVND